MKHDPELTRLILLNLRDGGLDKQIATYPAELVLHQKARLIEEGLASGSAIRDGLKLRWVKGMRIKAAGHRWLEERESTSLPQVTAMSTSTNSISSKLVFVSHCHADQDLAEAIVELLCAALGLRRKDFRCTSVEGSALPGGAQTSEQLRREIAETPAFISILTPQSLQSFYVLFELGARWQVGSSHIPLLARGMSGNVLQEPLKATIALDISSEAKAHQFIHDLAAVLGRDVESANSYIEKIRKVIRLAKPTGSARRQSSRGMVDSESEKATTPRDPTRLDEASERVLAKVAHEPVLGIMPLEFAKDIGVHRVRVETCLKALAERGLITLRGAEKEKHSCTVTNEGKEYLMRHGLA